MTEPTLVVARDTACGRLEYFERRYEKRKPARWYELDGERVPSVTQVLDVLHKPALVWWGQQMGVEGLLVLQAQGHRFDSAEAAVAGLTAAKLTCNHRRDSAAARGGGAHKALERWMTEDVLPRPLDFAPEERGYVQGLARALLALRPELIASEVIVASAEHRYAGRYDLKCRIGGRVGIVDLKTSKRVYPETFFPQLEAYALADEESGAEPVEFRAVLRLDAEGDFELVESTASPADFLDIKGAFHALERVKAGRAVAA